MRHRTTYIAINVVLTEGTLKTEQFKLNFMDKAEKGHGYLCADHLSEASLLAL